MSTYDPLILCNEVICRSSDLEDAGLAFRFFVKPEVLQADGARDIKSTDLQLPAFVFRYYGEVYAYLNRCSHIPMEMDWKPGDFFSSDKKYLICATHDAHYLPETGLCVAGPCPKGSGLIKLNIAEREGQVYLIA